MQKLQTILLTAIFLFFIITSLSFSAHNVKVCASIPYDTLNGTCIKLTSSGNYGINSFDFISEDNIALLCSSERKIKIFNTTTNSVVTSLAINFFPEDFIFSNNSYYILSDYSIHQFDQSGKKLKEFRINDEFRFVDRMASIDNSMYILTADGNSYKVIENGNSLTPEQQINNRIPGWIINKDISVSTIRNSDHEFLINIFSKNGKTKEEIVDVSEKLGSALVIGCTDDIIYIDVRYIIDEIPLKTEREILAYSLNTSTIIDTIEIPENYHYYTKRDFIIHNNNLFKLFSLEDKTDLAELTYNPVGNKTIFPQKYYNKYHYNNHLPESHESKTPNSFLKSSDVQTISRDQILANADKYEKVKWHCSDKNTTNHTIVNLPDGGIIRTPEWVVTGDKEKMPYKWGGFTQIDDYLTRINAGAYAGDDYTSREQNVVSAGDTYCVGVDCSGFVSRVWGRTQREWTGSLPNISTQLQSWSQMLPGDIANKASSHTMLFVSFNPSGTFNAIHASGYDWRVSYMTFNLTDLTGYTPLKYRNIEEVSSVVNDDHKQKDFEIFQNYPNPFNPVTTIIYSISAYQVSSPLAFVRRGAGGEVRGATGVQVSLKVYDMLGREVAVLVNAEQNPGTYEVIFNGNDLPSGIYFAELNTGNKKEIKKMLLLR
jgi:hypothetical protein